ncbi:hypothetical protein VIN01S_20410 [Vibrio inusitatus NBRC 102082]|uniref:Uncharacterized protein n=1 Tax=Vibrio inusitatus NBRC 102082 TaxID=1219070 RepID=A0A4Y3HW08_9VIBR|nr:hypothetical protein [Vibrio inusitatus]GEA51237.1 hypothetical protein VIN01S_20410 [Vibrio inusitatus NBRC 102082]
MTKKMCKFNRRTIEGSLGAIYSIVAEPKFVCRSCARVAGSAENLCKPSPIPPQACRNKLSGPILEPAIDDCVLLAEAKATNTITEISSAKNKSEKKTSNKPLIEVAENVEKNTTEDEGVQYQLSDKQLKKQRKMLKKQEKMHKKLNKILRKEKKLTKKRSKLDAHLNEVVEATSIRIASNHLH